MFWLGEFKGFMLFMELCEIEKIKIRCVCKFFDDMNCWFVFKNVKYDVVDSFSKLMEIVKWLLRNVLCIYFVLILVVILIWVESK